MITVSVIVPVYNKRGYFEQTMESIFAQDLPGKEIILVDDASTDGSGELCETLYSTRPDVRIFHQERNEGAGIARNVGLRAARGRYVAFVDADDILHPGYLRRLYETAILFHADVVAENGTAIDCQTIFPTSLEERCNLIFMGGYLTAAYYKVYRTAFLRKYGIEFRPITFLEDVLFGIETFLYADKGVRIPGILYEGVSTPESICRGNLLSKCPAYIESILKACDYLEEIFHELAEAAEENRERERMLLFLMRLSVENHFREAAKQHSIEEINAAIAPILQREFGAHAVYVQTLLDWCMCIKVPS